MATNQLSPNQNVKLRKKSLDLAVYLHPEVGDTGSVEAQTSILKSAETIFKWLTEGESNSINNSKTV